MIRRAQPWLGTLVDISVTACADAAAAQQGVDAAFATVARVHGLMSFHAADSDVSRLNRAAPDTLLAVHRDTWDVLQLAQDVERLSGGLFDMGCAPHLVEWGLLPAPLAARPACAPGRQVLALEPGSQVRKLAPGWIDLGGIAKGHAVDLAVAALRVAGVTAACVNAGGDLRVFGPDAVPVTVRAPGAPGRAGATLQLCEAALATSASYFSARRHAGQAVSALVDPLTGRPLTAARSVSVRAALCAHADALTKVVLASGDTQHPALQALGASAFII